MIKKKGLLIERISIAAGAINLYNVAKQALSFSLSCALEPHPARQPLIAVFGPPSFSYPVSLFLSFYIYKKYGIIYIVARRKIPQHLI